MYLTQSAHILSQLNKVWTLRHCNQQPMVRRYSGVSDELIAQINLLCVLLMKEKLRRHGLLSRKVSILLETPSITNLRNIFPIIHRMSDELEKMHPRTFTNINLPDLETAPLLLNAIGVNLFRQNKITWGRIVSLMTIAANLTVDCVRMGHDDIVNLILESTGNVICEETGTWIEKEGGFCALIEHIRPSRSEHMTFLGWLTTLVCFCLAAHLIEIVTNSVASKILQIL